MGLTLMNISIESFKDFLKSFGVDTSSWGKGEAKTVNDLLSELNANESFLRIDANGIARVLRIVTMVIYYPVPGYRYPRQVLFEDHQILPDGRRKNRHQLPSGKIRGNEEPQAALERELKEELGGLVKAGDYKLSSPSRIYTEERVSKSYPALRSLYEIHEFHIRLNSDIIPDGYEVTDADGKTKLVFRWKLE